LPGREERIDDPPISNVAALVAAIHQEVLPSIEPPFALFGHSLGALVAFELTRFIETLGGTTPVALFASSCRAPHLAMRRRPIHQLSPKRFVRSLRNLGTIPGEVLDHSELVGLLTPALRADFACFETYRYRQGPPLRVPIVVLGGDSDPTLPTDLLIPWDQHSSLTTTIRLFSGGHFYMKDSLSDVVEAVTRTLKA
jgi:medium-chain acyl-[acyl-carrier-protein] hydrolase